MASPTRIIFPTLAILFAIVVSFVISEVTLRVLGFRPPVPLPPTLDTALFSPDPLLGWISRPDLHVMRAGKGRSSVRMLVLPDRSRATKGTEQEATLRSAKLYVLGCSFAFGWALPDQHTFAWKLQERFPTLDVRNHGTNGYGTYQSLLLLERLLSQESEVPASVVYAFCSFHADRNIADWRWVRDISTAQTAEAFLPYCKADSSGHLVRSRIPLYRTIPFTRLFSTFYFLEGAYLEFEGRERSATRQRATEGLIAEMSDLCSARGSRFLMAFLTYHEDLKTWAPYLRDQRINYVDCSVPSSDLPRFSIVDDGHPNAELNAIWAECISRGMGG